MLWEEWPSGLRHCCRIGRFSVQSPLGAWPGLGQGPNLVTRLPVTFLSKLDEMQRLVKSGEWGCPLDNGSKLAMAWGSEIAVKK